MAKLHKGQTVQTVLGSTGKVVAVDDARNKVVVKATDDNSPNHQKGEEKVFFQNEVR